MKKYSQSLKLLADLMKKRQILLSRQKKLQVKIFETETDSLIIGKDMPIYKSIESYTGYKKNNPPTEINDGERIFSVNSPKVMRKEFNNN